MFLYYIDDLVNINIIKQIIVDHLLDNLKFNEYKTLIEYVNNYTGEAKGEVSNSEFVNFVRNYINYNSINNGGSLMDLQKINKNKRKIKDNIILFKNNFEEVEEI